MKSETVESSSEKVADMTVTGGLMMLSYPMTLNGTSYEYEENQHSSCLIFHAVRPMENGNLTGKSLKANQDSFLGAPAMTGSLAMIQMNMPAMVESLSHSYAESDTSVLNDLVESIGEAMKLPGSLGEKMGHGMKHGGVRLADRVAQSVANSSQIVMETGQIHKQRSALLYGGTSLRTHTFAYNLRPRNIPEIKAIGDIIYTFRKYSAGTRGVMSEQVKQFLSENNVDRALFGTVNAPPIWFVEERLNNTNQPRYIDKFMFGPAAITNVSINKTPDQLYQTIAGTSGDPIEVVMEITMQEMIPTYSDYWETLHNISRKE